MIGHLPDDVFACDAPIGTDPGEIGSRGVDPEDGLHARTEFRVVSRSPDGTSLLEATPLTGRTNQIRIHLWHLGFPVCGDPAYLPEGRIGEIQTLPVGAPPLCLHAWRLAFDHPLTGTRMAFESPRPAWAAQP